MVIRANAKSLDPYYRSYFLRKVEAIHAAQPPRRVICMGSSRAAYAFNPQEFERVTGMPAFNFGIPAAKVIEWQLSAEQWIEPLGPALLVIGINGSEIREDYVPMSAAQELFSFSDLVDYIRRDQWSTEVIGAYLERSAGASWTLFHRRFELLKFLQEKAAIAFPKYAQLARERREIASRICPPDGYEHPWAADQQLMTLAERELRSPGDILAASVPTFSPDAPAVRRFRAFLDRIRMCHIHVIVAYLPNSPRAEKRWGETEVRMEAMIAACCHDAGVPYVSAAPQELPRTDADYFDETHMGLGLAQRVTRRIAERAVALGYLENSPANAAGEVASNVPVQSTSSVLSTNLERIPAGGTSHP